MKRFWQFRNAVDDPKIGELSIYGLIGGDGDPLSWLLDELTPAAFKAELDELGPIGRLDVMINSPGGDVFAGQAIHSMLVRHPATVHVYIDGLAASTASLVAMAGDVVRMPKNAMLMIHDPYVDEGGTAREHRQVADALDVVRESMIAAYQHKTELSHDELVTLMEAETWLTAEQAVAQGFADELETRQAVTAARVRPGVVAVNGLEVNLERFKHPAEMWEYAAQLRDELPAALTKRDAERALVAAGASHRFAKALLARGWSIDDRALAAHSTPKAPEDEAWAAPSLSDFTDQPWTELSDAEKRRIANHFVWEDEDPPATFGELKGGHHRPGTSGVGPVVWRAVSSGRMAQMPEYEDAGVRAHLERHYHQFERKAPWEDIATATPDAATILKLQFYRTLAEYG